MKINQPKPRGRPRGFDRDQALDHAIDTFWAKGYEGASIDDLTRRMQINRPSLYGTFGSKNQLFLQCLTRYAETLGGKPMATLRPGVPVNIAVADFFDATIQCATTPGKPTGCLIANVATAQAETDTGVRSIVAEMFSATEDAVTGYFDNAVSKGHGTGSHEPRTLARMVISVSHSIALRARAGADRQELSKMANDFLRLLFPEPIG